MSHQQTKHKWWVLIGTCIAGLVVALDFTIVNTVLNDIEYSLGASMHELQWFIAGFGITFCSFMTTMGKLADMLGRKKLLYIGMFVFTIASIGAGLSYLSMQLIACRLIQGVAGALIFPAGMAITVDAFPKEEEGKALGIYGSIMGIGLAFGPLLGGFITEITSWRWIFYISVPLMILSFIIISLTARESKLEVKPKIDWWGMFWLTIFISSLIYILTEGDLYGWSSITTIGFFIVSCLAFIFFLITEYRTKSPLLPLSLFKNHYVLIGCIIYTICVSSAWVISFYSPLYLATVVQLNPGEIGLMMLVMTIFTAIIPAFAGGLYDKKGLSIATRLVFIPLVLSYILFIALYYTHSLWVLIFAFGLFGIAWGAGNGIGMPIALSKLENTDDVGVVSGAVLTVFNTLGVIFLTVAGIIFYYVQKSVLISSLKLADVQITEEKVKLINQLIDNPQQRQSILDHLTSMSSNKLLSIYQHSFLTGYVSIALILLCITILAFVIYKWLK